MIQLTIGDVELAARPANEVLKEMKMRRVTITFDVTAPKARRVADQVMRRVFDELEISTDVPEQPF